MSLPTQPASSSVPATEPRAARKAIPVWLIILLFLLLYWAMVYFDQRSGWFDERVYAPYHSFEQVASMQPVSGEGEVIQKGKQLYNLNCAVCHMEAGTGNPANGCPPLAGSEWVSAAGPGRIIRIVSKGATGPIEVKGTVYSTGTMLAIGDQMPGDEKQKAENIAAIISYIRKTFGNNASVVTPAQVEKVRGEIKDRHTYFSPEELKAAPEAP
ncbi:MAG TPA: cytochrome c [Verrucomicrobiae bacterium]|nr:cytochrome c [Verrucomicrobiae bacterium]